MKRVFMKCVSIKYAITVANIQSQNARGRGVRPRGPASGEYGNAQAAAITLRVVSISGPLARLLQILLVDPIGGNADLRDVVEQVVDQHLDGRHRQEGQEIAAAHHAEHVPEVRAGAHLDVLDDVSEDPAPLEDAVLEHE